MNKFEESVYIARMAEKVERYRDMADAMKHVVSLGGGLNEEERELLSVAYQNLTGKLRSSHRMLTTEVDEEDKGKLVHIYKKRIEGELLETCAEVLELIDDEIIPSLTSPKTSPLILDLEKEDQASATREEDKAGIVFCFKMKGDYYRYIAEISDPEERQYVSEKALSAYEVAVEKAKSALPPTDPVRLGTALNFSVFFYEILGKPNEAYRIVREAFDDAGVEVENLSEENCNDTTVILELLRDNLNLWGGEMA